jgi:hypothetical protein
MKYGDFLLMRSCMEGKRDIYIFLLKILFTTVGFFQLHF